MTSLKKQRQYNLIFTTVAFMTIMFAIIIAVALNQRQQAFYSEAQNFAKHSAIYIADGTAVQPTRLIHLAVYAEQPSEKDWIGLFPLQGGKSVPVSKKYLTECSLKPQGIASVGFCDFSAPEAAGLYVFHLFRDTLFMTASVPFRVTAAVLVPDLILPAACTPQPVCLRQKPACTIPVPANGWCPVSN